MLYHVTTNKHVEEMRQIEEARIEKFRTSAIENLRKGNSRFEIRSHDLKESFAIDLLEGMDVPKWCEELAAFFETASPDLIRAIHSALSYLPNEKTEVALGDVRRKVAEILWAHRLGIPSVEALKAAVVLTDSEVPFPED